MESAFGRTQQNAFAIPGRVSAQGDTSKSIASVINGKIYTMKTLIFKKFSTAIFNNVGKIILEI